MSEKYKGEITDIKDAAIAIKKRIIILAEANKLPYQEVENDVNTALDGVLFIREKE